MREEHVSRRFKMDERNSFQCRFCVAFFKSEKELDRHVDCFHDSSDSEREDIGNNMINDVYYSSQESDNGSLVVVKKLKVKRKKVKRKSEFESKSKKRGIANQVE